MNILKELHKMHSIGTKEIEKNKVEFNYRMYKFVASTESNKSLLNDLEKTLKELIDKVFSERSEKEREKQKDLTQVKQIFKKEEYQIKAVFTLITTFINMLLRKENKIQYI